jgi:16S rRNA (adenine1518-N6/adenine1519-N6)-dimethyltransferase
MARQPLGQHFLVSAAWRARIRKALQPPARVPWVEIGAGRGEMTRELAADGVHVVAIETDPRLADILWAEKIPHVEVVHGDVLHEDLAALARGAFRVYGNLPYYITSPILHHLLTHFAASIRDIHIVIQWEVAERIAARPGRREYGYLSAFCQFYARPEILLRIPSGAFQPAPQVASALLRLTLPGEGARLGVSADAAPGFLNFVKVCFGQKRKMLRNNLRAHADTGHVDAAFAAAKIPPAARAEELGLAEMVRLFRELQSRGPIFFIPDRRPQRKRRAGDRDNRS